MDLLKKNGNGNGGGGGGGGGNRSESDGGCVSFSNLLKTVMTSDAPFPSLQRGQVEAQSVQLRKNVRPTALPVLSSTRPKQALAAEIENDIPGMFQLDQQQNHHQNCGFQQPHTGPVPEPLPTNTNTSNSTDDGYGWRKYGQKQLKNSDNSTSYYRCTYCGCPAKKKVLQCDRDRDRSCCVIDVVYLGHHNHVPPPRGNCRRGSRGGLDATAAKLDVGELVVDPSVQKSDRSDFSICSEDARQSPLLCVSESEQPDSSSFNSNVREPETKELISLNGKRSQQNSTRGRASVEVQEKPAAEMVPRKRIKESGLCAIPVLKDTKESTAVTHVVAGEGNSSDGYRWRKYGQKTLKGNSYVRSYYRCTSAGCSAHKQVERSTDDSTETRMTYTGVHDHDVPLPKKWHGAKVYPYVVSSAAAIHDAESERNGSLSDQSSTQWSNGVEEIMDERVLELGGEKALESARTLLSMGLDVRPPG